MINKDTYSTVLTNVVSASVSLTQPVTNSTTLSNSKTIIAGNTVKPSQDYDLINTLTFAAASGSCNIRFHRGSSDRFDGTAYYRSGTSGSWTTLSVSGDNTTFPISSTTMQLANDWNKDGNNYMTPSFIGQSTNLNEIKITQKGILQGAIGSHFMWFYAFNCEELITLTVPDLSEVTSIGTDFMRAFAWNCNSLTTLQIPDTSNLTSVDSGFMFGFAFQCASLANLVLAAPGWFANNNVNWQIPESRLNNLKAETSGSSDLKGWQALVTTGKTLYTNYIRNAADITSNPPNIVNQITNLTNLTNL